MTLKLRKCAFFQPKVDYLGHVTTPGKLSVAVDKSKAFAEAVFHRTFTQLRSFLGTANVYRRFVEKYSDIARPLNSMLRKDAEPDWDNPTNAQMEAFKTLKERLISPPDSRSPEGGAPVYDQYRCPRVPTWSHVAATAGRRKAERLGTN